MRNFTRTSLTLGILGTAMCCSSTLLGSPSSTDLNRDGVINGADLGILIENWGPCASASCPMDLDDDGVVGAADVAILLQSWGTSPATGREGDDGDGNATGIDLITNAVIDAIGVGSGAAVPGEWCATHQHYVADLIARGEGGIAAACPPLGPCDDPANRNAAIPTINTPIKTYRLSIHVFCENSGANCAGTTADIVAAVANLNTRYAPWRIQFVYDSNFVNNTTYRYLDTTTTAEEVGMKNAYANSPTTKLNVYVVTTSNNNNWGTFPWTANALTKQGGVVMNQTAFANSYILTHEVGHCVGLWHVQHGVSEVTQCGDCYEAQTVPPTGSDVRGDWCSDTNPTPTNSTVCGDPAGTDACSANPWLSTPYLNYMGYTQACTTEFTPQQAGRMHCWTTNVLSDWLSLASPPAVPGAPTLTKLTGGVVKAVWADNSNNELGFRVQRETKSGASWIGTVIVADVAANVTTATNAPGTGTFHYRVQSYVSNGNSAWSAWTQIKN